MKAYLLSLLGASLTIALVGILSPNATSKHLKWLCSLFFVCVLIAPLPRLLEWAMENGERLSSPSIGDSSTVTDYQKQMEEAVNSASRSYFAQTLTQMLEQRFDVTPGEVRCLIVWEEEGEQLRPQKITLILSGSAIWKNPAELEDFVTNLLGCDCVSAIE